MNWRCWFRHRWGRTYPGLYGALFKTCQRPQCHKMKYVGDPSGGWL